MNKKCSNCYDLHDEKTDELNFKLCIIKNCHKETMKGAKSAIKRLKEVIKNNKKNESLKKMATKCEENLRNSLTYLNKNKKIKPENIKEHISAYNLLHASINEFVTTILPASLHSNL